MPPVVANCAWRSAPGFPAALPYISRAHRSSAASTRRVLLAMCVLEASRRRIRRRCAVESGRSGSALAGNLPDALSVRDGVPECGVGPLPEPAELGERLVDFRRPEQPGRDDGFPRRGQQEVQVLDEGGKGSLAGASSEEQPGAPGR